MSARGLVIRRKPAVGNFSRLIARAHPLADECVSLAVRIAVAVMAASTFRPLLQHCLGLGRCRQSVGGERSTPLARLPSDPFINVFAHVFSICEMTVVGQRHIVELFGDLAAIRIGPVEELERAVEVATSGGCLYIRMNVAPASATVVARLIRQNQVVARVSSQSALAAAAWNEAELGRQPCHPY